eukprot:Nitzschia sp. Nitz4//scaffold133_size116822//53772//55998//NITZ4_003806-RA/size116822-snap-gene-0.3-mRNA-1//1//CDS//3329535393//9122//frame0
MSTTLQNGGGDSEKEGNNMGMGCEYHTIPLKGDSQREQDPQAEQQPNHHQQEDSHDNQKRRRNNRGLPKSAFTSSFSSEGSVESLTLPSLHGSLLRVHEKRDPLRLYEVVKVLGDGSMGSVSKVQKRFNAVGGSARKEFVNREKLHNFCFGIFDNCVLFCPPKKDGLVVDPTSSDDPSGDAATAVAVNIDKEKETSVRFNLPESHHQRDRPLDAKIKQRKYASAKSSSLIKYDHKDVYYALKSIHLDRCKDSVYRQELLNEIGILQRLDHPNIVKAMETFDFHNRLYLLLELCSGGDLYARDPYTEHQACSIVHSILDAVAYMHTKGITHRDLKFENVMFASPESDVVKVIDFGLSKKYSQAEHLHDTVGTVYTMAPEVLKGDYDSKCDVWSMGVIAFMLLSSSLPFYGKTRNHVVRKIVNGKYSFKGHRWKSISPVAREFVMECLVRQPTRRKSSEQMLEHAFILRDKDNSKAKISFSQMDRVQATIQTFAGYKRLKKLALLVVAHRSTEEDIGFLRTLFNSFDSSHDGEIVLSEFKDALNVYHYDEEQLEEMFAGMDIDGTGKVHYTEFLAATIEAHGEVSEERIADAFDRLDSDDSGYISVQNILDFLGETISEEFADVIIEEADVTKDHRISYKEFMALWNEKCDTDFQQNLQEVNMRRLASMEDMSVVSAGTDISLADSDGGISADSSDLGGGSYFFGMEKEKSVRGVWV